jgi:SAM-dependent methyltransferase
MTDLDGSIKEGHFARKQIFSPAWLISWSHRGRFQIGLDLAREFCGKRILDYGCGDGTFLAMVMASPTAPRAAVGSEVHESIVEDCRARLGDNSGLSFITNDELDAPAHAAAYDGVICMEVLEHIVEVGPVLDRFARLLAPSGMLIISVPVETGLPLAIKQAARRIAGWRGIGDYPGTGSYTLGEYLKTLFAGRRQHIERSAYTGGNGEPVYDHKGFNWMALREALAGRFQVESIIGSPLTWLPPHLGSQVWFLMRKKNGEQ